MKYWSVILVVALMGCEDKPTVEEIREQGDVSVEELQKIEQPGSEDSVVGGIDPVGSADRKTRVDDLRQLNPYLEIYGDIAEKVISGPLGFGIRNANVAATDCRTEGVDFLTLQEYAAWEPRPNKELSVVVCHTGTGQVLTVMPAASFAQDVELLFAGVDEESTLTLDLEKGENPWNTEVEIEFATPDEKNQYLMVTADGVASTSETSHWTSLVKLRPKKSVDGESGTLLKMPQGFAAKSVRIRARNMRKTPTEWGESVKVFLATDDVTDIADLKNDNPYGQSEEAAATAEKEVAPKEKDAETVQEVVEEVPTVVEEPVKEMTELEKQVAIVQEAFEVFESSKKTRDEYRSKVKDVKKSVKVYSAELRAANKSNKQQTRDAKKEAKEKKQKFNASALKLIDTKPYEEALKMAKDERTTLVDKLKDIQKEVVSAKVEWRQQKKSLNQLKKKLRKEKKT